LRLRGLDNRTHLPLVFLGQLNISGSKVLDQTLWPSRSRDGDNALSRDPSQGYLCYRTTLALRERLEVLGDLLVGVKVLALELRN
jgi:hypothetical protein